MLVLIATNELQGIAADDYAWTVEGELVTPVVTECRSGERCGCARGFPGLASARATTTAMVVDRPGITEQDLRDAVYDWLDRGGWVDLLRETEYERAAAEDPADDADGCDRRPAPEVVADDIVDSIIDEHVDAIAEVCGSYAEGTVVVRHGDFVMARSEPFAA